MIKKLLPFVFLFFIAMVSDSCCEETTWMNQAEITGFDYRECACCGGYFIIIEEQTYRFYELPNDSDIVLDHETVFPVLVNVNWDVDSNGCMGDEIFVQKIEAQ